MSHAGTLYREALAELRAGLRSGIVGLVFLGLAAYLLVSLTNADYVQKMGAADIARNAPSLVYLMSTGCMFFLFFAWAWVFAQPVLRDRQASLHEVVLSMPTSLQAVLWGRFIGASLVGGLLAGSLIAGFIAAPLLSWLGLVPPGSVTSPPWAALGFAWVWLLLPVGTGIGALYFLAALRTRSVAGPFALSAVLMLLWMFAVVVLKGAHLMPLLAAAMDPSLFTYVLATVETWTPVQKQGELLPLTSAFLFNRFVWAVLPLLVLGWVLRGVRREALTLERQPKRRRERASPSLTAIADGLPPPVAAGLVRWGTAWRQEAGWQCGRVLRGRALWIGVAVLLAMGVLSGFVHGVWHAEGPMVARPEFLLPLLNSAMFLIVAFVVAALVGMVWRRDHVEGFDAMLDATPAPIWLRPFGRVLAVLVVVVLLASLPGVASILVTALAAPGASSLTTPLAYQGLVSAPALLELGFLVLLVHACCSRAGVAYTVSMLLTFFLVLNHELGLVHSPLLQLGIPAHLSLSAIAGWAPWMGYVAAMAGYKLGLCAVMIALAVLVLPRGAEGGRRYPLARLRGPVVALGIAGVALSLGLGILLHSQFARADDPDNATRNAADAAWERHWLASAGDFSVAGGEVSLDVDPVSGELHGDWILRGVRATRGRLDAELPAGFELESATVNGHPARTEMAFDHLATTLGGCADACTVRWRWTLPAPGWSTDGAPPPRGPDAVWLRAEQSMPRLGMDPARILRAPVERARYGLPAAIALPAAHAAVAESAVAPAGDWRVTVMQDGQTLSPRDTGRHAPLAFALAWAPHAVHSTIGSLEVIHDRHRGDDARVVAADVEAMTACVARRLGTSTPVTTVSQWPVGLGTAEVVDGWLVLPETPDWNVAAKGAGHALRHAHIAAALARRTLLDAADLRDDEGGAWWSRAVPGAIGLLCVGDVDGLPALQQVMSVASEATSRALAGSDVPVGPLAHARVDGWVATYGPLAALGWTARQQPADFIAIGQRLAEGRKPAEALQGHMQTDEWTAAFGAPRASEVTVAAPTNAVSIQRWEWRGGGWQPTAATTNALLLVNRDGRTTLRPWSASTNHEDGLALDALPSYPRSLRGAWRYGKVPPPR